MNLAQAITEAQTKNEKDIASRIAAPKPMLDADVRSRINYFMHWCKQRGVRFLPAMPTTIAAFIDHEHGNGISGEAILLSVQAVELLHGQDTSLPNPCATFVVRDALQKVLDVPTPRTWSKAEAPIWASLPIEVRAIISKRAKQDSDLVRSLQNSKAELLKQLERLKGPNNAEVSSK